MFALFDNRYRVIRYGFPMTWLRATTVILPLSPTQYTILWFELFIDIVFYLVLSLGISFVATKSAKRLEAPAKAPLGTRFLHVILAAYSTRLISCAFTSFWVTVFGRGFLE